MATDIGGIVLHKVLLEPKESLSIWPKLKLIFFASEYNSLYSEISKYYNKYNELPSFSSLEISIRNDLIKNNLIALKNLTIPEDVSIELATEALINEFIQRETLSKLDTYLDTITLLDGEEIKQELADILMYLEEKTHISEEIVYMSDLLLIDKEEIKSRVPLGLNNSLDAAIGGIPSTELILIGGKRGVGKSIICTNLVNNQYEQGNIGLYFSIEMRARVIMTRTMSALAGVNHSRIRKGESTEEELKKLAIVRTNMFLDSNHILEEYLENRDYTAFEIKLLRQKLKPDNQIIIIDNQRLTLADIDLNIQKFKAQFKEKLKVVIIDYLNAIEITDIYNWKSQLTLSAQLKNLAEKHEVVIVAPYQIDASGEARFSKGILDKADIAIIIDAQETYIKFETTKTRNVPPFSFAAPINWDTLKMEATDAIIEEVAGEESEKDLPF